MPTIYVLKCANNKYYVGKTERKIIHRIIEHVLQDGSEWTKLHKPVSVIEIISKADDMDEDKYTKIYMKKYGIDNVRGGSYTSITLPEYKIKSLQDELNTSENRCYRCNRVGHFASQCYAKTKEYVSKHAHEEEENEEDSDGEDDTPIRCYRCNRIGHYASQCYAKKQKWY